MKRTLNNAAALILWTSVGTAAGLVIVGQHLIARMERNA